MRRAPRRLIRQSLDGRRTEERDIRPRIYVGPFGRRHVVATTPGGEPFVVEGPARTYRPGALVPTGSHTNLQAAEFILENAPQQGGSETPPLLGRRVTPEVAMLGTQPTQFYAYTVDPVGNTITCSIYNAAGAWVSDVGSVLAWPFGNDPSTGGQRLNFTTLDKPAGAAGRGSFYSVLGAGGDDFDVWDFVNNSVTGYQAGGSWTVDSRRISLDGFVHWVEEDNVNVRWMRDDGTANPVQMGSVALAGSVSVQSTRLDASGFMIAVVFLGSTYRWIDFQSGTVTDIGAGWDSQGSASYGYPAFGAASGHYVNRMSSGRPILSKNPGGGSKIFGAAHWPNAWGSNAPGGPGRALSMTASKGWICSWYWTPSPQGLEITLGPAEADPFDASPSLNLLVDQFGNNEIDDHPTLNRKPFHMAIRE